MASTRVLTFTHLLTSQLMFTHAHTTYTLIAVHTIQHPLDLFACIALGIPLMAQVEGPPMFEKSAVILFIIGSVAFVCGSSIDLATVWRATPLRKGSDDERGQSERAPTESTSLVST